MGLAGPKKQTKISNDPNNTKWHGDQTSFGRKLMTAQGWQPGQYLGAKNAGHADHYTAANSSHIRVVLKDDNLGLGAKNGSGVGHGECTGLDAFKDLLGRLNGKDQDDIEKEKKSREDLKRAIYTEKKWGSQRFVSGGFLIGDKIQELIAVEAERIRKLAIVDSSSGSSDSSSGEDSPEPEEKPKKSRKRKLEEDDNDELVEKLKKSKKRKSNDESDRLAKKTKKQKSISQETVPEVVAVKVKSKKSKKTRKSNVNSEEDEEAGGNTGEDEELSEKQQRKKERREKRARKEEKSGLKNSTKESKKKSKRDKRKDTTESADTANESTPTIPSAATSGTSTPMIQGRHAVRARFIAQKRLASMDVVALNQIFMITS